MAKVGREIMTRRWERRWKHPVSARSKTAARREGYDEVVPCHWPPCAVIERHEHPFLVKALGVAGEMWLTERRSPRHLRPGDSFELAAAAPHAERYGAAGATYGAARLHAKR